MNKICKACQLRKQTRTCFKFKNVVTITSLLELLHMDLFRPTRSISMRRHQYAYVLMDDYSSYSLVIFLT